MAASSYKMIGSEEFEQVMADYGAEKADVRGVREDVYDIPSDKKGLVVRVFSSLENGHARESGSDAIRTLAWSTAGDAPLAKASRTHRIESWESNLRPKIDMMLDRINAGEFDDETPDAALAGLVPTEHDEEGVIVVSDIIETRYGRKLVLESPYEAKNAIKSLDWDETHRAWDKARGAWTVDAMAASLVADHLADEGWPLRGPRLPDPDAFDFDGFVAKVLEDDHIIVEYTAKNSGSDMSKSGVVTRVRPGERVAFRRDDDGHTMYVTDDGLFTARSAHPYVGEVTDITRDGFVIDDEFEPYDA